MASPAVPVITAQTLVANAVSLTTATSANILAASFTLGPGQWKLEASVNFIFAATTSVTVMQFGLNTTTAVLPTVDNGLFKQTLVAIVPTAAQTWVAPSIIVNLSTPTAYFLVAQATFTVSTLTASGIVVATQLDQ